MLNSRQNKPILVTFVHEFVHSLEKSGKYREFLKFVWDSKLFDKWVQKKSNEILTKKSNKTLTKEELWARYKEAFRTVYGNEDIKIKSQREMICDFVADMLFRKDIDKGEIDPALLEAVKNHTFVDTILSWLKRMIEVFKKHPVQAELIKMQNDIQKLYKQAQKQGFADGEVKYSITHSGENNKNLIDLYTAKQYNDFGWVRVNDVLTPAEYEHFKSSLSDNKNLDFKLTINPTTKETIIPTGNTTNLLNVFVYVKGTFKNPVITKVVRLNSNDLNDVEIIRSDILDNESRGSKDTLANVKDVYGKEYFISVEKQDMPTFQELKRERERNLRSKNIENSPNIAERRRNNGKSNGTEAGLNNSTFSNGEKYSLDVAVDKTSAVNFEVLDKYTEKTYNERGWVTVNNVLTKNEQTKFYSQFADSRLNKFKYPTTPKGETIITVGDKYSDANVLVFAKGTNKSPIITKIVRINADEIEISIITEELIEYEQNGVEYPYEAIENYAGKEVFNIYTGKDSPLYRQLKARKANGQKGRTTSNDDTVRENGARLNTTGEAGLDNSAFSNGEKYSLDIDTSKMTASDTDIENNADDVIELTTESELFKEIEKSDKSKYDVIRDYIFGLFGGQDITLSDGRNAIVDRSDARHIAHKANERKIAEISKLEEIIKNAKLSATDNNVVHNKFDYFCYYETKVRYKNKTFSLFLNIGRAKNDGIYHLYDITDRSKKRDTADHNNGLVRPVGNALTNGISTNIISESDEIVKYSIDVPLEGEVYDTIPPGEKAARKVRVPKKVDGTYTNRFVRTIMEHGDISEYQAELIKMRNDIQKLYKQAQKQGFENGEVRYSKNVDLYTEKQYNNFGWIRVNDVLTVNEYNHFTHEFANYKKLGYRPYGYNPVTKEAIIRTGDNLNVLNVFVYVRGDIDSPEITRVVRFATIDKTELDIIKEGYVYADGRESENSYENVQDVFGNEFVTNINRQDMPTFQEYRREQKRSVGGKNPENTELNEKRTENRTRNTQTEAGLDNSAFSNGEKYSLDIDSNKKITVDMSDSERAEILKNKSLTVEHYRGQADNLIEENSKDLESKKTGIVKKALKKVADNFGNYGKYDVKDFDVEVSYSSNTIKESVSKVTDTKTLSKLFPIIDKAIENAVGISSENNRYYYDTTGKYYHTLLSGYVEGEYFFSIRFGVKENTQGENRLYIVVEQNKIDLKVLKTQSHKNESHTSRLRSIISISEILKNVNSKDLLRYVPDEMLDESQKKIKYEGIAETIKYTNDKNNRKYAEFVKKGDLASAARMVEAKAKDYGYTIKAYHGTTNQEEKKCLE